MFLGRYAINPVNGERIPVWAADYVLPDYGTGAIMAVPAHDQRDLDFARRFGLPVRIVVETGRPDPAQTGEATPGEGELVNSGPLDGLDKSAAIAKIIEILTARGLADERIEGLSQGADDYLPKPFEPQELLLRAEAILRRTGPRTPAPRRIKLGDFDFDLERAELTRQGHKVGADTVADLLRAEGFSLQGNAKTIEGRRHPDRDTQFRYINDQVKAHQGTADPVISVDTKKK